MENASFDEKLNNWDSRLWDRPYMSERELANLVRDGENCKPPCRNINFDISITHVEKEV